MVGPCPPVSLHICLHSGGLHSSVLWYVVLPPNYFLTPKQAGNLSTVRMSCTAKPLTLSKRLVWCGLPRKVQLPAPHRPHPTILQSLSFSEVRCPHHMLVLPASLFSSVFSVCSSSRPCPSLRSPMLQALTSSSNIRLQRWGGGRCMERGTQESEREENAIENVDPEFADVKRFTTYNAMRACSW